MTRLLLVLIGWIHLLALQSLAQEKTRKQRVLEDREAVLADRFWIYNDLDYAFELAKQTDRPLLVVFRCIPCEACAQLDASIVERDPRVRALLGKYVCVRVVHANGMDLGLFQYDYDQSFAAFLMNGDKTIYGRYGTRSHQRESENDVAIEGFAEALEAGLRVHEGYPDNKSQLAGKQSQTKPAYSFPEEFPELKKYGAKLDYEGTVAASCIHCHQVGEVLRSELRDNGKPISTTALYPYPHPKVLGLIMDPKQKASVVEVSAGSPAGKAGIEAGDKIIAIAGQPILSTADIQWALHNTADSGTLEIEVARNGKPLKLELELAPGWRTEGDISWRASSWALRRMVTGGLQLEEAPAEMHKELQLDDNSLALLVKHVGQWGDHAHAKRQGFQQGDVVISIAGNSQPMRESDLFALLVNKPIGERVSVKVLRGGKKLDLILVMQK